MEIAEYEKNLFAYDEDKFVVKIPFQDVFYIETIKSSHYCMVIHKKGECRMRADIIHLEKVLDENFLKVRSSTLVNVKYIEKIDTKNRNIYFTGKGNLCCTYSGKSYPLIKEKLQIRSYRREENDTGRDFT